MKSCGGFGTYVGLGPTLWPAVTRLDRLTDRWVPILGDSCARPSVPCRHLSESCTWEVIMRSLITVFTAMLVATGTATAQDVSPWDVSRWERCDAWRHGPVSQCERDIHAYISGSTVFERHWHVDGTPNGPALVNKFNPGISYPDLYSLRPNGTASRHVIWVPNASGGWAEETPRQGNVFSILV